MGSSTVEQDDRRANIYSSFISRFAEWQSDIELHPVLVAGSL